MIGSAEQGPQGEAGRFAIDLVEGEKSDGGDREYRGDVAIAQRRYVYALSDFLDIKSQQAGGRVQGREREGDGNERNKRLTNCERYTQLIQE